MESLDFIKNIERRVVLDGVTTGNVTGASTVNRSVNESGIATYNVAKAYDAKVAVTLSDGSVRFLGVYNS